jgi:hypothetical protein
MPQFRFGAAVVGHARGVEQRQQVLLEAGAIDAPHRRRALQDLRSASRVSAGIDG